MTTEQTELKKNADWYYANLDSLLPKYNGKYIAISGGRVLGDYDDFNQGVDETLSAGHPLGSFIVHLCVPREKETPWICLSGRADFSRSMS
jgi:hypothetical protein